LSSESDMIWVPSDENATERTKSEWPVNVLRCAPLNASHSLRVLSQDPDMILVPSGEYAIDEICFEWPSSVLR